jgi:hypothetical protein
MVSYISLSVALGFLLTLVMALARVPQGVFLSGVVTRLAPNSYEIGRGIVLSCLVEIGKSFVKYLLL